MCHCDRLNGIVCAEHCTSPYCCDGEHVDRCLGLLPATRSVLEGFWRCGVTVTLDLAASVGAVERALR